MKTIHFKSSLISPCGMNCGICLAFLREKNKCPGCNLNGANKPLYCTNCSIKNCEYLLKNKSKFCFDCDRYPCRRLKDLDKRYRTKYGMSMIDNLNNIKASGIRAFIKQENTKWVCTGCGTVICVHRNNCLNCGKSRL